jgi:hypothetical protein
VTIPNSVTSIGSSAFWGCRAMTSVVIGSGVTTIGTWAFRECTSLTSVVIGSGVTAIDTYAFLSCTALTSITIPNGVTIIGIGAFKQCTSLTSVTIPNSVTSIGSSAFWGCTAMTSVVMGSGVTAIGGSAFYSCTALTSITFRGMVAPTSVGTNWVSSTSMAIRGHAFVASNFPAPGATWNGLLMGNYNPEIPGAPILSSATAISSKVTLVWTEPAGTITGYKVFYGTTSTPTTQFGDILSASTLTVDVTSLTPGTLYYFAVKAVNQAGDSLPSNVLSATPYTVPAAPTLSTATAGDANATLIWIAPSTGGSAITGYKVFYGTTSTPTTQFGDILSASTLTVDVTGLTPGVVYYFGVKAVSAFGDSPLSNVLSAKDGDYIYSVSGAPAVATIISYTGAGGAITIPSTLGGYPVVALGIDSFNSRVSITSVAIPYGVTSIGQTAFQSCTALTSVTIPGSVTNIGYCAFISCTSLTSAAIPESATSIGEGAFCDTALTFVNIPNGVTSIGSWMFDHCDYLTSVTIPDSVTSIGMDAFRNCISLTSVKIPDGVTSIGSSAFSRCRALTSVNIPSGVTSISDNTFSYCASLTSVTIPSGVTSIDHHAFISCGSLTSMTFLGLSKPTYVGYGWTDGGANLRGHAYAASNFPAPGGNFNGLIMGDYIVEAPGAPTVQSAIERNDHAILTWAAPSSGGLANGYKVFYGTTSTPTTQFGNTLSASTVTVDVTGLTPGVVYYFGVKAVNAGGDSPLSNVLAGTIQYQLTISANMGGVTPANGLWFNASDVVSISATAPSASVGEAYVWNGWVGTGAGSYTGVANPSTIIMNGPITEIGAWTRIGLPSAVSNLTVMAGDAQVILTWSAQTGASIDYYVILMDGVEAARVTAASATIGQLVNGRTYSFKVAAHNAAGNGSSSAEVSATPFAGGGALSVTITVPQNDSLGNSGSVLVQWKVTGNSPLQKTEISADGAGWTMVPGFSATVSGLNDGPHTIYVRATNAMDQAYTASVRFTIDSVAPYIVSSSPNGTKESTRVVVNVTFSKAMDQTTTKIVIQGVTGNVTWNGNTATFTPDKTLIGDTQYNVTVTGQDMAGNQLAVSWTFRTDKVGTVSGTILPSTDIVYRANTIYFKRTITILDLNLFAERAKGPSAFYSAEASRWERTTLTDEQGRFWFYDVPIGTYVIKTTDPGFESKSVTISLTEADVAKGGVSMSMTVNPVDNTPLYAFIGAVVVIIVVLVLFLLVRRNRKNSIAKGKETAKKDAEVKKGQEKK